MDGKTCLVRAVGRGRRVRVRTPDFTFLASLRATWWGFSFVFISLFTFSNLFIAGFCAFILVCFCEADPV